MPSNREDVRRWIVVTVFFLSIFVIGGIGMKSLTHADVPNIVNEQTELRKKLPEFVYKAHSYLAREGLVNESSEKDVLATYEKISSLKLLYRQQKKQNESRRVSSQTYRELQKTKQELLDKGIPEIDRVLSANPNLSSAEELKEYRESKQRLSEIQDLGWRYSGKGEISRFFPTIVICIDGWNRNVRFGYFRYIWTG